jgi:hypothetical protein
LVRRFDLESDGAQLLLKAFNQPRDIIETAMTAADEAIRNFLENLLTSNVANKVPDKRMKLVKMAAK